MKAAIKWIISCVVLYNLLADPKDQWNKLYEVEEPELAPPLSSLHLLPTTPPRPPPGSLHS
ncbi:hypothetical protein PCASD_10058 [Puccinia coronata f. sp. avenae]|uniref:Uncharacterized protein n=1 Tax=Puccinia coronata f. sp. avenae TaxID=200324 RepID=A0A2N5UJM5_9BASI|nr:hypothetical protein PCASD_10058 [Puccinia coronata f. sp. avenae]